MTSVIQKITTYIKDSIAEMKKVIWPSKQQTIQYTLVVIALSVGMAIFFRVLDFIFTIGLEKIIK